MNLNQDETGKFVELFWDDLNENAQHELEEILGSNGNYDVFPMARIYYGQDDEEPSPQDSEEILSLRQENVKVAWLYIGEGLCGDYDPDDDDDVRLLRFCVFRREDISSEWEVIEDSSYCTMLPLGSSKPVMLNGLNIIMDAVFDKARNYESIKKVCELLSHIDEIGIVTNKKYLV